MKIQSRIIIALATVLVGTFAFTSCTDKVAFGDSFLDKASGNSVTEDTVFNSATYT